MGDGGGDGVGDGVGNYSTTAVTDFLTSVVMVMPKVVTAWW